MLEDTITDAELEFRALRSAGIACIAKRVENEVDFRKQLSEFLPDLIISDFSLPASDGLSAETTKSTPPVVSGSRFTLRMAVT